MCVQNEIKLITTKSNLSKKEFACLLSELRQTQHIHNKCNKESNYVCNIEKR